MRRFLSCAVCSLVLTGAGAAGAAAESGVFRKIERQNLPNLHRIYRDRGNLAGDSLIAVARDGHRFRIQGRGRGKGLRLVPDRGAAPAARREAGMLPDGVIARGTRGIRRAWLTRPTGRYGHGVLGDAIEAAGVRVETAPGAVLDYVLPADSVFEDRHVRLADVDGDGRDEALVVRSYLDAGAALAVLSVTRGRLEIIAEAAPLGIPFRWLNPVGVADFDGDGRLEIAAVTTPHIGGILRLYRVAGARLVEIRRESGFSNHAMGSRELGLSAVIDTDGDGVPELAIPASDRRSLRVVGFAGGRFRDRGGPRHRAPVSTALHAFDIDGDGRMDLVYGLADGTVIAAYR